MGSADRAAGVSCCRCRCIAGAASGPRDWRVLAWFVGHWSFAVRNDLHYRSRLARVVIDKTPLRWTIPRYWQLRRERRLAHAR